MNSLSAKEKAISPNQSTALSLMVSMGDLSADKHTSRFVSKLKSEHPDLQVWGLGSSEMRKAGAEILYDCQEFSSIGLASVFKVLPILVKIRQALMREIERRKPKAILLVDYSGFNLLLAQTIRGRYKDLPIYYFISPQVWGSRPWRMNTIAKTITKMLVIFPFEETLYKEKNIPVSFVGHPLTTTLPDPSTLLDRHQFADKYNLDPNKPIISIFPGSRKTEIKNLLPVPLAAVKKLNKERPEIQFAISQISKELGILIAKVLKNDPMLSKITRLILPEDTYSLMSISDFAWAKNGTTTLELTLFAKPMLVFYRADWISYLIFQLLKRTQRASWPSLLAGKLLVPELFQLDCKPEKLVQYSKDILDVPALSKEMSQELQSLKTKLGEGNYAENCASQLAQVLFT